MLCFISRGCSTELMGNGVAPTQLPQYSIQHNQITHAMLTPSGAAHNPCKPGERKLECQLTIVQEGRKQETDGHGQRESFATHP